MTAHRAQPRHTAGTIAGLGLAALLAAGSILSPGAASADALSANTLSLSLGFTQVQTNLFGYSYKSNGAQSVASQPMDPMNPGMASLMVTVPQDVVFVAPNNSDSKATATSFKLILANLSGSGGGAPAAIPYDPMLHGSFTYHLDDSAVDNPLYDSAASTWWVKVSVNGAVIYSDTLSASDPQDLTDTIDLPLGGVILPANSITKLVFEMGLFAEVSSYRPPAQPEPPLPPPPPPVYPPVPEPATWALMITGLGLVGAAARRRRLISAI